MRIVRSDPSNVPLFRDLWQQAASFQAAIDAPAWTTFPEAIIAADMADARHFMGMRDDGVCSGYFSVVWRDEAIWQDRDRNDAIYIHRMCGNTAARGERFAALVFDWAIRFAIGAGRAFVRMDTWAENARLIAYYERCGFIRVGTRVIGDEPRLPPSLPGHQPRAVRERGESTRIRRSNPMTDAPVFFETPTKFAAWLRTHHARETELLVGFYKKASGRPSLTWPESVAEALCVGWIDGIRRARDEDSYTIRFTPRKPKSTWSAVNVKMASNSSPMGACCLPAWRRSSGGPRPRRPSTPTSSAQPPCCRRRTTSGCGRIVRREPISTRSRPATATWSPTGSTRRSRRPRATGASRS